MMGDTAAIPPVGADRARRMRRQARLMRLVNVPMRRLLRLPFPTPLSSRLMLLTLTGRRTGRTYLQPVSYVRDGDTLLTPGGGRWTYNLTDGRPITIRLRGREVSARPQLIADPAEVEALLDRMIAINPRLTSFVPFVGEDRTIDPDQLRAALDHHFRIIRWHGIQPCAAGP